MSTKEVQHYCRKHRLILTCFGILYITIPVLIHRGIHGKYGIGKHGLSILFLGSLPFIASWITRLIYSWKRQLSWCAQLTVASILSTCLVIYYLSSNGLWCVQHPNVTRELCSKLIQFATFAKSLNVTSWWLTKGELLAVHRGLDMPIPWEHDIDICIAPEQFPIFEKALNSARVSYFNPKPEDQGGKVAHWYLPIDMAKLGLTNRDAEGVNLDIWTCPKLSGNITQLYYCNGLMNFPGSLHERQAMLTKYYGDYSAVKYEHHATMCRIWNGW